MVRRRGGDLHVCRRRERSPDVARRPRSAADRSASRMPVRRAGAGRRIPARRQSSVELCTDPKPCAALGLEVIIGGGAFVRCNAKRLGGCLSGSFDRLTATRAPRRGGRNLGCIRLRFQNAFQPFIGPGAAAAGAGLQNAKRAARGGSRSRTPGPVSRSRAHSPASRARPAGRAGCRSGRPPWVLVSPAGLLKVKCRFVGCGYSQVEGIEGLR